MGPTYRERAGLASLVGLLASALASCCFTPAPPLEEVQVGPSGEPIEPPEPAPSLPPEPARRPPRDRPASGPYVEPAELVASPTLTAALDRSAHTTPQRSDAPALFARARPVQGAIHRGLLLCRARVRGSFDDRLFAGGADVAMGLVLGGGRSQSTPVRPSRVFSFPVEELAPGTTVALHVVDRDVLFDDPIASAEVPYERTPFTVEREHATVECRAMPSVEVQAARAVDRYRAALAGFVLPTPDLEAEGLGFPSADTVVQAAEGAASWLGWESPELLAGREQAGQLDVSFTEAVGRRVAEATSALPPFGEPVVAGELSVRATRVVCGDGARAIREEMGLAMRRRNAAPACHVVLELTARRATRLEGLDWHRQAHEAWTLGPSGRRELAERVATRCGERWIRDDEAEELAVGESCEVHLGVSRVEPVLRVGARLVREPILLRLE